MIRWRLDVLTLRGNTVRVDIDDSEHTGGITNIKGTGQQPILETLESEGAEIFRTVAPSSLELNLISESNSTFDDIFTAPLGRFRASVYLNSTFRSEFIIIPDINDEPRDSAPYPTAIYGANLSLLREIPVDSILTDEVYSRFDAIWEITKTICPNMPIVDGVQFWANGTDSDEASLPQQFIRRSRFARIARGRVEFDDAFTALSQLVPRGHQLRVWNGRMWIVPIGNTTWTAHYFDTSGEFVSKSTFNANDTNAIKFEGGRGVTRKYVTQPFGQVERSYFTGDVGNIVPSGALEFDDFAPAGSPIEGYFPIGWNIDVADTLGDRVLVALPQIEYAFRLRSATNPLPDPSIPVDLSEYVSFKTPVIQQGNITLSIKFALRYNAGSTGRTATPYYIKIQQGDFIYGRPTVLQDFDWYHEGDYPNEESKLYLISISAGDEFDDFIINTEPPTPESADVEFRLYPVRGGGGSSVDFGQIVIDVLPDGRALQNAQYSVATTSGSGKFDYTEGFGDSPISIAPGAIGLASDFSVISDVWRFGGVGATDPIGTIEARYILSQVSKNIRFVKGDISGIRDAVGLIDGFRANFITVDYRDDRCGVELFSLSNIDLNFPVETFFDREESSFRGSGVNISSVVQSVEGDFILRENNLSDVADTGTARINLDVYSRGDVDDLVDGVLDITDDLASAILANELDIISLATTKADKGTRINSGDGLTGGGLLTDDVTVTMGEPSKIDVGTANAVTSDSHTHQLDLSGRTLKIEGGNGIVVDNESQNLGANRTWVVTADVVAPVAIQSNRVGLNRNEPLYLNGTALDVRDHADGVRGVLLPTAQDVFGDKTFRADALLSNESEFRSASGFVSGFTGSGFQLKRDSSIWQMELDDMFIRGALFASEFIINQISALNGSDFLSPAVGKVEAISGSAPSEVLTLSDPQGNDITGLVANDIVIVQQVTPDAYSGGGQIVKRIVRLVSSVTDNVATLTDLQGSPPDDGSIAVGDVIVVIGNTTNTNRQAHIYRSVIDNGAPFVRINDEVNDWESFGELSKLKLQYGNLSGLSSLGASGFGLYTANAFLTGSLVVGDLTKTGNYLEYDGTNLKVVADEIFIGTKNVADELGSLESASLDIQSALIQLQLQSQGAYSGLTFLAGQVLIKATDVDPITGLGRLAQISLDATADSGSIIKLKADDILLDAGNSVQAFAGDITGDVSALQLTANTFDLYSQSSVVIGETATGLIDLIDEIPITPFVSAELLSGSFITIEGVTFEVTTTIQLTQNVGANIQVVEKLVSAIPNSSTVTLQGANFAGISGRVDEQGSELVLKAQSDGTLSLVALTADPQGESAVLIKSDKFKLETSGLKIDSSEPMIEIGTGGVITNEQDSYIIEDNGITIKPAVDNQDIPSILTFGDRDNVDFGQLYYSNNELVLNTIIDKSILIFPGGAGTSASGSLILRVSGTGVSQGYIIMIGLPTSDPGGSNRVWNDNGTLKITQP